MAAKRSRAMVSGECADDSKVREGVLVAVSTSLHTAVCHAGILQPRLLADLGAAQRSHSFERSSRYYIRKLALFTSCAAVLVILFGASVARVCPTNVNAYPPPEIPCVRCDGETRL